MTRSQIPAALIIAAIAVVLGGAGLIRGWVGPSAAEQAAAEVPASAVKAGDIAVYGAYVREPASDTVASAYLIITNIGDSPDTLTGISTGASQSASVHDVDTSGKSAAKPSTAEDAAGVDSMVANGPVTIAPGQTIKLSPGSGHIMMEQLLGQLLPGQTVSILLTFARAGDIVVVAPIIAIGVTPPAI